MYNFIRWYLVLYKLLTKSFYRNVAWSNGTDSHDSGIGHSPPFDSGLGGSGTNNGGPMTSGYKGFISGTGSNNGDSLNSGIWGELNKVLGGLDLNGGSNHPSTQQQNNQQHHNEINKQFLSIGSRSSLDLGTLGRPSFSTAAEVTSSSTTSTLSSSNMLQNTANGIGRQMSLPTDHNTTLPGRPLFSCRQ